MKIEIRLSCIVQIAEKKPKELSRETKCGSAVLTALQMRHLPIDEAIKRVSASRVHAFMKGADLTEWMDVFWRNVGIVIAAEIAHNVKNKTDR